MENVDSNSMNSISDVNSRSQIIKNLIFDHKGDISVDLLFDIFQNLILDCKYLTKCNSNRYLNSIYQKFESINNKLYNWRINSDDFNTLKIIGQGAFGQVQLVRHRTSGRLYAMKILNKSLMQSQEGSVFWKEERDIMTKLDCRWIVKVHFAFQDPRRLYMAMEYLPGGTLVNWMSNLEDIIESEVCFYIAEIVLAISALHEYHFVHRDIKPDNILFDYRGHIKLADFGTCVRVDPVSKLISCNRSVGTPDYISPEVLLSQSTNTKYGCEIDWWALGVVLYEIFYGDPPFYSEELIVTYSKILTFGQSLTFPPDDQISDVTISLIRGLICDRSIRLEVEQIKQHRFFINPDYDWSWDNIQDFDAPFIPNLKNDWDTSYFDFNETDDVDQSFNDSGLQEIGSKNFSGENLQFSGFSYSDIFNDFYSNQSKNAALSNSNSDDQTSANEENKRLSTKLQMLINEIHDMKSSKEKITIERQNLEIQLQAEIAKYKHEAGVSKKLQADYSDLISKHGQCDQKMSDLEKEKGKLISDLDNAQTASNTETRRLLVQIQNQEDEVKSLHVQLSDNESEYRKSKLQNVKLENDLMYLQKKYDCLQQEMSQLRHSNDIISFESTEKDNISAELNEVREKYDTSRGELESQIIENERLVKLVANLKEENKIAKISIEKVSNQLNEEKASLKELKSTVTEKQKTINSLKATIERYDARMDSDKKILSNCSQRLSQEIQTRNLDYKRYNSIVEEQRQKFNALIANKITELNEIKNCLETTKEEKCALEKELNMEKAKCTTLVNKIDEIITGNSSIAREMMITEDVKSGKLDKRSGRKYNEILKQNKKLQSQYEQLQQDVLKKEVEFNIQIENLTKEKKEIDKENNNLRSKLSKYETRNSISSPNSQNSYDSDCTVESSNAPVVPIRHRPMTKPPMFTNINSISGSDASSTRSSQSHIDYPPEGVKRTSTQIDRYNKTKVFDSRRASLCDNEAPVLNCPEGQLDVNVKQRGKKMTWERRFVKIDSHNLEFYDQSLSVCFLKLPLSSLLRIRGVTSADIIHAKSTEIPRIFQIIYDKNKTLSAQIKKNKSVSGSNSSINTVASGISDDKDRAVFESSTLTSPDHIAKQDSRRNSIARFLPKLVTKQKHKSIEAELTIDSMDPGAVLLKGHIFQPILFDSKSNCDICSMSLLGHSIDNESNDKSLRTKVNRKHMDSLSSIIDLNKNYKCYHCCINVHGSHLDDRMSVCDKSVVIQLCRASTEQEMSDWIKFLNSLQRRNDNSTFC